MATQFKFTAQLGKTGMADVTVGAGSAEAQSDTVSVNVDYTKISKREALDLLETIEAKIMSLPWPAA